MTLLARGITAVILITMAVRGDVRADTYATFQTTRFYSSTRRFFVRVTPDKNATLYRLGGRARQVWRRKLATLPAHVLVSNDGHRVALIDIQYGNGGDPDARVVTILGGRGSEIAGYALHEVTDLKRVLHTTSSAHWYYGASFSADSKELTIETAVRRCSPPAHSVRSSQEARAAMECFQTVPYERIVFSAATGVLIARANVEDERLDAEARLRHDIRLWRAEYAEDDGGPRDWELAYPLLDLARLLDEQARYAEAEPLYREAVAKLRRALGEEGSTSTAEAIAQHATHYRRRGRWVKAEALYKRALRILDRNRADPYYSAAEVYENYATLLELTHRQELARTMRARAKAIRAQYPDESESGGSAAPRRNPGI